MTSFIGDFVCKIDAKGRMVLPSLFKKAMASTEQNCFVIRKDLFEECLVLTPQSDWELEMQHIRANLNLYNKEQNLFYRQYFRGAAEVTFDQSGRLNIPKRLLEKITLDTEYVFVGLDNKIELWSKLSYDKLESNEADLSELAEKFLGNKISADKNNND